VQGKQNAVLWMGLILVLLRGITNGQFQTLWSTTVTAPAKPKSTTSSGTSAHSSSESGYTGTIMAV
jgi:hypothetical protein